MGIPHSAHFFSGGSSPAVFNSFMLFSPSFSLSLSLSVLLLFVAPFEVVWSPAALKRSEKGRSTVQGYPMLLPPTV